MGLRRPRPEFLLGRGWQLGEHRVGVVWPSNASELFVGTVHDRTHGKRVDVGIPRDFDVCHTREHQFRCRVVLNVDVDISLVAGAVVSSANALANFDLCQSSANSETKATRGSVDVGGVDQCGIDRCGIDRCAIERPSACQVRSVGMCISYPQRHCK